MNEISSLIEKVRDNSRRLDERHDAFAALVKRYQDMAFGCAYAVLGDFYLAEDCAQEAFVSAWQSLHQLRAPGAFPAWLRRIVLTKCNRLIRGKRLQIVPLELAASVASAEATPESNVERSDLTSRVLAAVHALPEDERLATTLFYVDGYTQTEICDFLDLPETTVNKRLYSARQRLKNSRTLEMFRKDLHKRRPSRNDSFAEKLSTRLRPFGEKDWPTVSAMTWSTNPDPETTKHWLQQRHEFNESQYVRRHYIAENADTAQILGYGAIEQSIYLPRYRLIFLVEPRWLQSGVGELLLEQLDKDLHEVDAVTVTFRDYETSNETQAFLKEHGFAETMRLNDWRLDLQREEGRGDVEKQGRGEDELVSSRLSDSASVVVGDSEITISTLQHERQNDPNYVRKLYDLTTAIRLDDPSQDSFEPPAYYEREARLWLEQKYVLPDGYFIAKHGNDYVGVSDVNLRDAVPGGVSFGFTGVRRDYRRRGLARHLKVCAIEWARSQNYRTIRALNQPSQSVIADLNKKPGFEHKFSYVTLEKCLRSIAEVDTNIYDKYSGQYQDDEKRPELVFTVKNERGRLTAECIGQKVELFPESSTRFFSKPFYGEFNFITDESGNVTHLDSKVRSLNQPEAVLHASKID